MRSSRLHDGVDRVARRARHLVDDRALLADELVVERRLADVRAAEDRDANRVVVDSRRADVPGRRSITSSSRSPVFEPCRPEIGNGSPKPSRCRSSASDSCDGSSILFAISSTSFFDSRRICASSSSPGVTPARASTMKSTRSASAIAARACSAICARDRAAVGDVDAAGVDQQEALAVPLAISSLRSRVVPCVSCTTACRVDGQPVDERRLADVREADDRDRAVRALGRCCSQRRRRSGGRPCAWTSASQSKRTLIRRSISTVASL